MDTIYSKSQLIDVCAQGKILIFGAGAAGSAIAEYVWERLPKIEINFLVTDKTNQKPGLLFSIFEIADIQDAFEEYVVIVSLMGKTKEDIYTNLCKLFNNVYCVDDEVILEIRHLKGDFNQEIAMLHNVKNEILQNIELVRNERLRGIPWPRLQYFILNICDHCNLNCKGCNHFSSIADKKFYPIEEIQRDIKQMFLVHGEIPRIGIMGGEPLLHPDIKEILEIVRKQFPKTEILLSTNGTLCDRMPEIFWQTCKDLNIIIRFTKYPVKVDYEKMENEISNRGIQVEFFMGGEECDMFDSLSLDTKGRQNQKDSFYKCIFANNCIFLKEGRLYTCQTIPNICHFNKKFNLNLEIEEGDSIDIYEHNREEVLEFLSKPAPFCRYCNVNARYLKKYKWGVTKGEMSEWI